MPSTPAVPAVPGPLTNADLKLMNQALYKNSQAVQYIDQAAQAGVDPNIIDQLRMAQQAVFTKLTAIKQTYWPTAP